MKQSFLAYLSPITSVAFFFLPWLNAYFNVGIFELPWDSEVTAYDHTLVASGQIKLPTYPFASKNETGRCTSRMHFTQGDHNDKP